MKRSNELEDTAISGVASFMAAAARTAPKTRGVDNIVIAVIDDDRTKATLAGKMKEISKREKRPGMERDANSITAAPIVIVIGVKPNPAGLNCGYCGYRTCDELKNTNATCAYNLIDLGIAACAAVSSANQFHVDNRIMYSIGRACLELNLLGKDIRQAIGIPLSVTGKNPFFDRG